MVFKIHNLFGLKQYLLAQRAKAKTPKPLKPTLAIKYVPMLSIKKNVTKYCKLQFYNYDLNILSTLNNL